MEIWDSNGTRYEAQEPEVQEEETEVEPLAEEDDQPVKHRKSNPQRRIDFLNKKIAEMTAERDELMRPILARQLAEKAASMMTPQEMAEKLGITLD